MSGRIRGENSFGTKIAVAAMALCGLALLPGCPDFDFTDFLGATLGGSDNTGGGAEPPTSETDVTGTWTVTEVDSSNCDGFGGTHTDTWDVTQTGSRVEVRGGTVVLTGTITGNTINLQGSFSEDGGITTVTGTNITVGPTGNTISGSETWTWSDGLEFCFGTTSVTGSRD